MAGGRRNLLFATVALSFVLCSIGRAQQTDVRDLQGPAATISMPWSNSLVRANVPVFGVANAKEFKQYRVEFGEGRAPKEWHVIKVSTKPQPSDPWAAGKVRWNPNTGAGGNLATWDTGLTSYSYGMQTKNLNGVYTVRVVVEDKSGKTAEARVVVTVARVLGKAMGGIAESCDGKAFVNVERDSVSNALTLFSIQPIDPERNPAVIEITPPRGLHQVGKVYEFQPPGLRLLKPGVFRILYDEKDLKYTDADGKERELPEEKLGLYAFLPVEELWGPLPDSKSHPETNEVRASFTEVTRYISFYAVMADITPPAAPAFDPVNAETEKGAVSLSGKAEPFSAVELFRGNALLGRAEADVDGRFSLSDVPLVPGENVLTASAVDHAKNRSEASASAKIVRACHPPRTVKQVEILGKVAAERGERFLVKIEGEDSDPKTNAAYARVSSETDKDGFELELTETGPATGVYVAVFSVGEKTNPAKSVIAARKHREKIEAASAQDKTKSARIEYLDTVPPPAPAVECPTHPSLCQDTFEDGPNPLDEWANVDGEFGAALSRDTRRGNTYLKLTKQEHRGHLGAAARSTPYAAVKFPLIAFDYLINPDVKMDVQVWRDRWQLVDLNDPRPDDEKLGSHAPIGAFRGIVSDGRWHRAELDLRSVLAAESPNDTELMVGAIQFINWDQTGYMRTEYGLTGSKGSYYCIDNFRILDYGGANAEFKWSCEDENGIAGYSYVLDQEPGTIPPEKVTGAETAKAFKGIEDGRWHFHVRAQDGAGNWGATNHYMVFVDAAAPKAEAPPEAAKRPWNEPIRIRITDGKGSGVNPYTILLRVSGRTYSVESKALAYDAEKELLTFDPVKVEPSPWLPADGEKVEVELVRAADYVGRPVETRVAFSCVAQSPLTVTPLDPDGRNGWYVTPPKVEMRVADGGKAGYEWLATPEQDELFKKGNSINVLTVIVKDKTGAEQRYRKEFRLDTSVPAVKVETSESGGKVWVTLGHDDRVHEQGGLRCELFASGDLSGAPISVIEKTDLSASGASAEVRGKARSMRWTGSLYPAASGIHRFYARAGKDQRTELVLNGEVILDTGKLKEGAEEVGADVVLKRAMIPIEVRRYSKVSAPAFDANVTWQREGAGGEKEIPLDALFAVRSLATVSYWWDDGKPSKYEEPIAAPSGKHTLHCEAVDEAGHRSGPNQTVIEAP